MCIAHYHLPGLFEHFKLYEMFLEVYEGHRDYFYEWCDIGSIYGAPNDCIWGGGRVEAGSFIPNEVLDLMNRHSISSRLTFSNSLLNENHLQDSICNNVCELFSSERDVENGVIIHSDLLLEYLKKNYPGLYFVSSTTKVKTDFSGFIEEIDRDDFSFVVLDFRLNKEFDKLKTLTDSQKAKVEFLCNECCYFGCKDRYSCYEAVSRRNLGDDSFEHICKAPQASEGYSFSKAMENPGFIGINDIKDVYLPLGFSNFKIEGRGLGSAVVLEFLLYYMVKPEYHIHVREKLYLDNSLDLF